jgi:hypothetical protein
MAAVESHFHCSALGRHGKLNPKPAAWATAMKRPQFGIRLMLLIVALTATIFAWRRAAFDLQSASNKINRVNLESKLSVLERQKVSFMEPFGDPPKYRWLTPPPTPDLDAKIDAIRKEMASLQN